ncbi:MAG: haloacid dehalogenase [Thermaerobacter sp.]|nr:haloacid dehalogenase [Thermaerobacter sp.]
MSDGIRAVLPGVYASSRAAALAEVVDLVVFDVDGVLIDVSQSFPVMICEVVTQYLRERGFTGSGPALTPEETRWFKTTGGFNSDWLLAEAAVLFFLAKAERGGGQPWDVLSGEPPRLRDVLREVARLGGGLAGFRRTLFQNLSRDEAAHVDAALDRARIERLAKEFYAGPQSQTVYGITAETYRGPALMASERPLVADADLPPHLAYGLYTGRTAGETAAGIALAGVGARLTPAAIVNADGGVSKPNPAGLVQAASAAEPRVLLYVGDNLDDWDTAARYETERGPTDPPCLFAGILSGVLGPAAWELFEARGAEVVADNVKNLLRWLAVRQAMATGG